MSPALPYILLPLCLLACAIPGVRLALRCFRRTDPLWNLTIGTTLGLAVATLLFRYAAVFDYRYAYPALLLFFVSSFIPARSSPCRRRCFHTTSRLVLLVLGVCLVIRLAIAGNWLLPRGWDPSFHCLLASRVQEAHHLVSTWEPYEAIPLNYPLTPHVLLAALSTSTGLPIDRIFSLSIAFLTVLLSALVYPLARSGRLRSSSTLAAVLLFSLTAWLGSVAYMNWGGLPNLLGMCFLLASLSVLLQLRRERYPPMAFGPRRIDKLRPHIAPGMPGVTPPYAARSRALHTLLLGTLLAATILSHHHVMLAGGAVILAAIARHRRGDALPALALGLLLAAPQWVELLLKLGQIRQTDVATYVEALPTPMWFGEELPWGLFLLLIAMLASLILAAGGRHRPARPPEGVPPLGAPPAPPPAAIDRNAPALSIPWYRVIRRELFTAALTLQLLWVLLDFGCRLLALALRRPAFTLFTPSRFLTDAVPFICLFAGVYLAGLLGHRKGLILIVTLILSLPTFWRTRELAEPSPLDPRYLSAVAWIRENSPPTIMVDNGMSNPDLLRIWMCYLSRRRAIYTPLPTSEPIALIPERKAYPPLLIVGPKKWVRHSFEEIIYETGPTPTDIAVCKRRDPPATRATSEPAP